MEIKIKKTETPRYAKIEVREPLVEDMLEAQKHGDGIASTAALIAQICTFDGKTLTTEDVQRLPVSDFLELQAELTAAGLMGSHAVLSRLSEMAASPTKA